MKNKENNLDSVFAVPLEAIKAFEFDDKVTAVFQDMISRSVPGYELLVRQIGLYADVFVTPGSQIYDLGCSLGEVTQVIAHQIKQRDCQIIAVDNAESMIEQCRTLSPSDQDIQWICDDLESVAIENASMVVLNLTLQFLNPEQRQSQLQKIYDGLLPGAVLVLSEKFIADEKTSNERMIQLHQAFKKAQGYSNLEISQKRTALEDVLIPDSEQTLWQRLRQCGFSEVHECFRCFNFISFLAIK